MQKMGIPSSLARAASVRPSSSASSSSPSLPHLVTSRMSVSWLPYVLTLTVIVLCATPVQSRWCTRLVTYTTIKPYVETIMCNQSYQEACGFWTYAMCTRYELVECMVERNKTLTQYKVIEACCPGYKLNPANNLTCIETESYDEGKDQEKVTPQQNPKTRITRPSPLLGASVSSPSSLAISPDGEAEQEKVTPTQYSQAPVNRPSPSHVENKPTLAMSGQTTVSGTGGATVDSATNKKYAVVPGTSDTDTATPPADRAGGNSNSNSKNSNKSLGDDGPDARVQAYQSDTDGKLFGLTKGAYTGIVCLAAFILCVVVLISIRLYKRKQKSKRKAEKKQQVEMDAVQGQSMMASTDGQAMA